MNLTINTDGGSRGNPGEAAIGVVVADENQQPVYEHGECLGVKTNNEAEYAAFAYSLQWLREHQNDVKHVDWHLDSMLVVEQLNKRWKIKEPRLAAAAQDIWLHLKTLPFAWTITYVPRAQNKAADLLVNQALDSRL